MTIATQESLNGATGSTKETWKIAIEYITGRKRAERALGLIAKTGAVLAENIHCELALQTCAQMMCPSMGDACVIDVINDDGGLYQAALHFDANVSVAQRGIINIFLYPQVTPLSGGVIKVIEDGKHEAINTENVGPDDKLSRSGRLAMNGFKAALIVPIRQRERTIGTITLFSLSVGLGRSYTKHDLVILEQIALRIAAALEIKFLWEQITEAAA